MFQKKDSIDRMRIASPCPMNWDKMTGDHRARYCDLCNLHVYNISELTSREVKTLIANTEGRICARLYKRADGTVITKDCPVGLRAIRRRVSRVAGAAITTIFSFCMSVMGQSAVQEDKSCPSNSKVTVERTVDNQSLLQGKLLDQNGAVLPGIAVTLIDDNTKQESKTITDADGLFKFHAIEVGCYDIKILGTAGFSPVVINQVKVEKSQAVNIEILMTLEAGDVFIGLVALDPLVDTEGPGLKTTKSPNQITTLPY